MHKEQRRDSGSSSGGSSTDSSSPDFAPVVLDLSDDRRPSDVSGLSTLADERRPSGLSTDSSLLVYSRRPSGLEAFEEVDEPMPPRVQVVEEGGELLTATAGVDDGAKMAIRWPVLSPRTSMPEIARVHRLDAQRHDTSPYAHVVLQSPRHTWSSIGSSSSSL